MTDPRLMHGRIPPGNDFRVNRNISPAASIGSEGPPALQPAHRITLIGQCPCTHQSFDFGRPGPLARWLVAPDADL